MRFTCFSAIVAMTCMASLLPYAARTKSLVPRREAASPGLPAAVKEQTSPFRRQIPGRLDADPGPSWEVKGGAMASLGVGRGVNLVPRTTTRGSASSSSCGTFGQAGPSALCAHLLHAPEQGKDPLNGLGAIRSSPSNGSHWDCCRLGHQQCRRGTHTAARHPSSATNNGSRSSVGRCRSRNGAVGGCPAAGAKARKSSATKTSRPAEPGRSPFNSQQGPLPRSQGTSPHRDRSRNRRRANHHQEERNFMTKIAVVIIPPTATRSCKPRPSSPARRACLPSRRSLHGRRGHRRMDSWTPPTPSLFRLPDLHGQHVVGHEGLHRGRRQRMVHARLEGQDRGRLPPTPPPSPATNSIRSSVCSPTPCSTA